MAPGASGMVGGTKTIPQQVARTHKADFGNFNDPLPRSPSVDLVPDTVVLKSPPAAHNSPRVPVSGSADVGLDQKHLLGWAIPYLGASDLRYAQNDVWPVASDAEDWRSGWRKPDDSAAPPYLRNPKAPTRKESENRREPSRAARGRLHGRREARTAVAEREH